MYEEKVDGWRMLAYKDGGAVKLVSRNGRDHTQRFPGLVTAIRDLEPSPLILDGEVAAYDRQLISRFEWLRHNTPPDLAIPPLLMVFDSLHAPGTDLRARPYMRRNLIRRRSRARAWVPGPLPFGAPGRRSAMSPRFVSVSASGP